MAVYTKLNQNDIEDILSQFDLIVFLRTLTDTEFLFDKRFKYPFNKIN